MVISLNTSCPGRIENCDDETSEARRESLSTNLFTLSTNFENELRMGYGNYNSETLVNRLKMKPPHFYGKKGVKIRIFFSKLEKYFAAQKIPENEWIESLGLLLENEALLYFDRIIENESHTMTYENIKEQLTKRYGEDIHTFALRSKINNMKMSANESVKTFFYRLKEEALKVKMGDEELSFLFQNGLEGELKTYTNLQNPKSSQQALEIALNFEQISTLEKKKEDITQHKFIAAACHAIVQTASIPSIRNAEFV